MRTIDTRAHLCDSLFDGNLPLACLMVESDSPVPGPEAGERNRSANGRVAIETIAQSRGETLLTGAEAVSKNPCRFYR